MATGSADIAACAKVSDFGTLPLALSSPSSLRVSLFLSLACQYASTCLMGPSEELTADMLVSLFPPAILLELASVISHATDMRLRPRHLSSPPSTSPHISLSLQRMVRQRDCSPEKECSLTSFLRHHRTSYLSLCPQELMLELN